MKQVNWKYGLGEIIIVVIGLYCAFALNSYKENLANQKLKKEYLESISLDITKELKSLKDNDSIILSVLTSIHHIKPFLGNKKGDRDTIVNKVFELTRMITFHPENSTYQTLINSGDMKLVDNFKLRKDIQEHYSSHKIIVQSYRRLEDIQKKYFDDLFVYTINFDEIKKGNNDFLDNKLLKNIIVSMEGAYYLILNQNSVCQKNNHNLLEKINSLLES